MKSQIIKSLLSGEITTVPTETVEGYAVCLNNEEAIRKLMKRKERDYNSGKVFTLVPASPSDIVKYAIIPEIAKPIIKTHIPGELTAIFKKNPNFKNQYYDHFETVGIRIPNHPLFNAILPKTGPLILTSANPRGGTPKSITGHLPSTIVDFTGPLPRILRQGNLYLNLKK